MGNVPSASPPYEDRSEDIVGEAVSAIERYAGKITYTTAELLIGHWHRRHELTVVEVQAVLARFGPKPKPPRTGWVDSGSGPGWAT